MRNCAVNWKTSASYLLDTNHVSGILRKNTKLLNRMAGTADAEYGIPLPAIGELWFMVYNSDRIAQNSGPLQQAIRSYKRWPFNGRAAIEFGRIKAELRRLGRPIQDVDVQIAAIARTNDLTLLSDDHASEQFQI